MTQTPPTFTRWTLVALVVGNAVGAGIYTTSGYSLADLGAREWVLLAWLVGGLIALAGALSYGMLVHGITESGGEYLYLSRSIHPVAGYIAGWISLLAGFPGAIAFAASAFEAYLTSSIDLLQKLPESSLAVAVVVAAGVVHSVGVRLGAQIHEWIVSAMLAILTVVIVVAGAMILWGAGASETPATTALTPLSLSAFASSLVWISLSYSGFNAAAYVAGEVTNARVIVPQGMVIGTLLTLVLCLAVNAIILFSAPFEALVGRPDIALVAADGLAGAGGRWFIQLVIAISLLTSITAMVLAGPRVYAKMAADGALPRFFKGRAAHPPRASIALQVVVASGLILLTDLRDLLSYLGFTLSLCLALAVSSLFVRHWRLGERPSSRFYPFAPVVFVLCTVGFAVLSALHQPAQFAFAVPTLLAGAVAYWVTQHWRGSS